MNWKVLFLAAFIGSGCAAKKLAVNNADFMLEQQIQKRLPLYSAQKHTLSKDVDDFLNQQKPMVKEAMPIIATIELDVDKVDDQYHYLKERYDLLALAVSQLMSKHMAILDKKQQKDFLKVLKEENKKLARTDQEDIMDKIHDRFNTLFGSQTKEQAKLLETFCQEFERRHNERFSRRKGLHSKFQEIYSMNISAEARTNYFLEAFKEYQLQAVDSKSNLEMIKKLLPTLSKKQKEIFHGRIEELKEILKYFIQAAY